MNEKSLSVNDFLGMLRECGPWSLDARKRLRNKDGDCPITAVASMHTGQRFYPFWPSSLRHAARAINLRTGAIYAISGGADEDEGASIRRDLLVACGVDA